MKLNSFSSYYNSFNLAIYIDIILISKFRNVSTVKKKTAKFANLEPNNTVQFHCCNY